MELRYRSSRLDKLTVLTKILPYLALASLIGCGIDGKDREEVGRFLYRDQFVEQYLAGGCLAGTSWDITQELSASGKGFTRESYSEYYYSSEPDIVVVHSGLKRIGPLVFRATENDRVLVADAELTQRQLDVHGC